jgi:hypothetical protein
MDQDGRNAMGRMKGSDRFQPKMGASGVSGVEAAISANADKATPK